MNRLAALFALLATFVLVHVAGAQPYGGVVTTVYYAPVTTYYAPTTAVYNPPIATVSYVPAPTTVYYAAPAPV